MRVWHPAPLPQKLSAREEPLVVEAKDGRSAKYTLTGVGWAVAARLYKSAVRCVNGDKRCFPSELQHGLSHSHTLFFVCAVIGLAYTLVAAYHASQRRYRSA